MAKYDDWSWHSGGDFPADVKPEYGGTHIAMYLMWCIDKELVSVEFKESNRETLDNFKRGKDSYLDLFFTCCDGKFIDDDLNDEGNKFAKYYFDRKYVNDYSGIFGDGNRSVYYTDPTWDNYEKLKKLFDERYISWTEKPINKILGFIQALTGNKKRL